MAQRIVGIVSHPGKDDAAAAARLLVKALSERGIECRLDETTARYLDGDCEFGRPIEEVAPECELIVSLGGDGLILNLAHRLRTTMSPLFGLNTGRLGFLTCMHWSDHDEAVEVIFDRRYTISPRVMLALEVFHGETLVATDFALNDVVVSRGLSSQLIRLQTMVDGEFLTEYHADGLIVATPTGSTAYSLAAGGPILSPDSGVFVITPICPHVLTNRSVIIPDSTDVTIGVEREAWVSPDGRPGIPVGEGDRLLVRRSGEAVPLVTLPGTSFYAVLREKMRWAGSNLKPGQA